VKVPNAENAIVPERKCTAYLLDLTHTRGGPKAHYFIGHGYTLAGWLRLADDLRAHVGMHKVSGMRRTQGGTNFEVTGALTMPDGATAVTVSVWYIADGGTLPRLVTARPAKERRLTP